ncbi:MAG: restriction endonuclease subunit S [Campylobacterota bacterium]|nr:restriction endonuclease subunit S [Campylobacterota bacterium]
MKLKQIADIRTGLVLSRKKAALSDNVKIGYKQITLKSFSNSTSLMLDYIDDFVSTEEIDDSYISREGDVVVRLRDPVTAVCIDKSFKGMVVPSFMSIVRVNSSMIDNEFLAYYINSITAQRVLEKKMKLATIFSLKTRDLEDLEIVLPTLKEQKRVVALMKLSEKEIQLLEKLKKEKEQFGQAVLDTIIQSNKDNK